MVVKVDRSLFYKAAGETTVNFDGLVKSLQGCHSRERGSPEVIDFPGFPRSLE